MILLAVLLYFISQGARWAITTAFFFVFLSLELGNVVVEKIVKKIYSDPVLDFLEKLQKQGRK
jgi:diacylglycerol kinase